MRKNKRSTPSKYFRILILGLLMVAGFLSWRLVTEAAFFKVSQVEVAGDPEGLVATEVVTLVKGTNLVLFPEQEIKAKLASQLSLERVEFTKQFPGKIVAKVSFRQPFFSFQSSVGRFLVDKYGVLYAPAGSESLPQVSDQNSNLSLGQKLPDNQLNLVRGLLAAVEGKFTPLVIKISAFEVTLILSSNIQVLLTVSPNLDRDISALQLITTQAKIEGKIPRLVDLRYSKPLVTY